MPRPGRPGGILHSISRQSVRRIASGGKVVNKYFVRMGGQSNMEGIVPISELPSYLLRQYTNTFIYFNQDESLGGGAWQNLKAGVNNQRSTAAAGSDRLQWYGIEIALADLFERDHPNDQLYISKYAVGGTSVAVQAGLDWNIANTGESLDIAIDNYHIPGRALVSGSVTDLGLVWFQGEQDASSPTNSVTATFRTNSLNTLADFRTRLGLANMEIIVCRLNASIDRDPTDLGNVRTAQGTTSGNLTDPATNPDNTFFDTDTYSLVDTVHIRQFLFGKDIYNLLGL